MRRLVLAAGLLLSAGGCSWQGTFEKRPGQDRAEAIVWNEMYGMEGAAPPVEWVRGTRLFGQYDGLTVIGSRVVVADYDGLPIHVSAMAHEFMHYRTWVRTGDPDLGHERGDWRLADDLAPLRLKAEGL